MSDLKFNCPSCGQHVQCDIQHAGENIPCPSCAHLIRVPTSGSVVDPKLTATENPFATDDSKVSYTATKETEKPQPDATPTLEENIAGKTTAGPPVTHREEELAAARAAHTTQPSSQVKPRLSFILSGGQAPAREENDAALTPEQKKLMTPKKPDSDIKTINE